MSLLEEWRKKNAGFAAALQECESKKECGNLNLAAFLLEPIQRIPRFKLLLSGRRGVGQLGVFLDSLLFVISSFLLSSC